MVAFSIVSGSATIQHQHTVDVNVKDQTDGNVDVLMIDVQFMVNGEHGVCSPLVPNRVVVVRIVEIDYVIHLLPLMVETLVQDQNKMYKAVTHNLALLMVVGVAGVSLENVQNLVEEG